MEQSVRVSIRRDPTADTGETSSGHPAHCLLQAQPRKNIFSQLLNWRSILTDGKFITLTLLP